MTGRALVTLAVGPEYGRMLDFTLPPMQAYAEQHDYDLLVADPRLINRPPSWLKIPALGGALNEYEEVLWLDADVLIVDDSIDLAETVPPGAWQAMVRHHTADGEVPNCGVWFLRSPMFLYLEQLWEMTHYLQHGWWEQAGMLDLLGYWHLSRPVTLGEPTELYRHTHWLDLSWNSHESADRHPDPRFAHATCGDPRWRLEVLRRYVAQTAASTLGG